MNLYIDRFIAKSLKLNISLKFKQYGKDKLQKQLLLGIDNVIRNLNLKVWLWSNIFMLLLKFVLY